jgi:hypothetical protein
MSKLNSKAEYLMTISCKVHKIIKYIKDNDLIRAQKIFSFDSNTSEVYMLFRRQLERMINHIEKRE